MPNPLDAGGLAVRLVAYTESTLLGVSVRIPCELCGSRSKGLMGASPAAPGPSACAEGYFIGCV